MATFNSIVDVSLTPEGKPASQTTTSHTKGTKISEGVDYVPPAPSSSSRTVYVDKLSNTKSVTDYK